MLGHANLSQTNTYLNAGKMGLQNSMRRFEDIRCNPIANEAEISPPLDRNAEPEVTPKALVN